MVAMVLAYFQFRKDKPGLLSWTLEPLIGKDRVQGGLGKTIDALAVGGDPFRGGQFSGTWCVAGVYGFQ